MLRLYKKKSELHVVSFGIIIFLISADKKKPNNNAYKIYTDKISHIEYMHQIKTKNATYIHI